MIFSRIYLKKKVESGGLENTFEGVSPCPTIATKTGSLDTTPVLSSNPQPRPCSHQPTLNKPRSSAAQTAARCHTLDPLCQHWVREAGDGLCVPSNTHVSVRGCQIVSNSSHPTLKYLIVQHPCTPLHLTHTHTLTQAQYPDLSDPGGCGSVQRH